MQISCIGDKILILLISESIYFSFQFCKTVRKLLLSRRVAKATAVLGACLLLYLRAVSTWAALLAVLLPFLIWMAS